MSITITHSDGTLTALRFVSYSARRRAGNIVHPIPDREAPDVTLRPASLRSGQMQLAFDDEATADEALDVLAGPEEFALEAVNHPVRDMTFIVTGDLELELDERTNVRGLLTIEFQEMPA